MIIAALTILLTISAAYCDFNHIPRYDLSGLSREDLLKIEHRLEIYHHHTNLLLDYEKLIYNQELQLDDLRLSLDGAFIRGRKRTARAGIIAAIGGLVTGFIAGIIVIAR